MLIQIKDNEEAPTLEDIYFVLNKINDKNLMIKNNVLRILWTTNTIISNSINYISFNSKKFSICVLFLTPFQFLIFYFKFIDTKKYLIWLFVAIYLYNYSWVEVSGYLLWRIIWVRKIYYGFWKRNNKGQYITMNDHIVLKSTDLKDMIRIDLSELQSDHYQKDTTFDLAKEIRRIIDENRIDYQYNNITKYKIIVTENYLSNEYEIIEIVVQQNKENGIRTIGIIIYCRMKNLCYYIISQIIF